VLHSHHESVRVESVAAPFAQFLKSANHLFALLAIAQALFPYFIFFYVEDNKGAGFG